MTHTVTLAYWWRCLVVALLLLPTVVVCSFAYPGGIVGRTLAPSCGACHGPASASTTVTMMSTSGSYTTSPGGSLTLQMTVAHASKAAAGVNIAVHDIGGLNAGTLSVDNNSGLRISLGEITHSAPKLMVNGTATFTFAWTAPTTPGSYYLRGSGNAVDNTGGSDNDQFNYVQNGPIYLNVTGQVGAPSVVIPANGATAVATSSTLTWTAVSGAIAFEYQLSTMSGFSVLATSGTVYSTSSVAVANLRTGTVYYWRVRSLSVLSTGAYVSASFATVSGPPTSLATPVIITPLSGATGVATTATLMWSTIPEALQYDYQFSTRSSFSPVLTSGTISLTTATIAGLQYNTVYYWRVRARYGAVLSSFRTGSFTTLAGPPPRAIAPANHSINIPSTAASISWSVISDAAGYNYQLSTTSSFSPLIVDATTLSTTALLPALQRNVQYFWRVRAYGTAMGTTPFTTANFVTEIPKRAKRIVISNAPEYTPKSFVPFTVMIRTADVAGRDANVTRATALAFADNNPQLSVVGVTSIVIDMGQHVTTLSLVLLNTTTQTVTADVVTSTMSAVTILNSTTQTIAVEPLSVLAIAEHIAPVSNATAVSVTTPTQVVWKTVEGATMYTLHVSTSADFSAGVSTVVLNATDPFATTATAALQLSGPAQYWWRVQAANVMASAAWSVPWNFIAGGRFLAPVLLTPLDGSIVGSSTPDLQWRAVGSLSNYRVQASTSAVFSSVDVDVTTANIGATLRGLSPGTSYYWRVQALADNEVSAWSPAWLFTTQPLLVVYPSGGEWLLARSSTTITWSSAGVPIDQVRIELSTNGSWQTVTTATANTGAFVWTVPYTATTQAVVRITDITNASVSAVSNDVFNIAPAAPLDVTLLLEGAYVASGTMATLLQQTGSVPLSDPYTGTAVAAVIPPNIVDWVQLEFRAADAPDAPGLVQSFLLRSDGRLAAANGSTTELVDISRIVPGAYRLVVRHRNHVPVMSAAPVVVSPFTVQTLNLSDSANAYTSFGAAVKEVDTGRFALIGGDVTADGSIGAADRVAVRNASGQTGYVQSDISIDGIVSAADRIVVMNNRFAASQVP